MAHYTQHVQRMMQECRYSQAVPAKNDVINMMSHYSDLKPIQEWFTFNNGAKKQLVCISGTIPVSYRGQVYNIPIAMYVMDNHPAAGPFCFVKPTASMQVRHSKHVDKSGRIYLPYLSDWRPGRDDLTGLVEVMIIMFGEEPPVVSRPPANQEANLPYTRPRQDQVGPAKNDITSLLSQYPDLRPAKEWLTFDDGTRKHLVCISGTIPVGFNGRVYNIPVEMYLMDNHPAAAPVCFVSPSSSMEARRGKYVDANNRIHLRYLSDWRQGECDLTGLIQAMIVVFGEDPPVVSKAPASPGANSTHPQPGQDQMGHVSNDVTNLMSHFSDLTPTQEWFTFDNGITKHLVCISGTIPVDLNEKANGIPIAIYLMDNHPVAAPICFVKPTELMEVQEDNRHVDAKGRIHLRYLSNWHPDRSDLTHLVQVMVTVFSEDPPVFPRLPTSRTTPPDGDILNGYLLDTCIKN